MNDQKIGFTEIVKPYRYDLWKYFSDNHNLTLLESELAGIVNAVNAELQRELEVLREENQRLKSNHART